MEDAILLELEEKENYIANSNTDYHHKNGSNIRKFYFSHVVKDNHYHIDHDRFETEKNIFDIKPFVTKTKDVRKNDTNLLKVEKANENEIQDHIGRFSSLGIKENKEEEMHQ